MILCVGCSEFEPDEALEAPTDPTWASESSADPSDRAFVEHEDRSDRIDPGAQCDDACAVGDRVCEPGGYRECGQWDADHCAEWGGLVSCPEGQACAEGGCVCQASCAGGGETGLPEQCGDDGCGGSCGGCATGESCESGVCATGCIDDCVPGERICAGGGFRVCGQSDFDACLDWSAVTTCGDGQTCAAGACECAPSCAWGGGGLKQCGDDGCGGSCGTCGAGTSCSASVCLAECEAECATEGIAACFGNGVRTCGQHDKDGCLEWSSTTPCGDGMCVAGACASTLSQVAADGDAWETVPISGLEHAPDGPIQAAFGEPALGAVWVFTADTWHGLNPMTLQWVGSGPRYELVPEVTGLEITAASAVPSTWGTSGKSTVTLNTGYLAWVYEIDPSDLLDPVFVKTVDLDEAWSGDTDAPNPNELLGSWISVQNDAGWVSGIDVAAVCGAAGEVGPYQGFLTSAGLVHVYEAGYCFTFEQALPAATWGPFSLPGAPAPATASAVAWTGTKLLVF